MPVCIAIDFETSDYKAPVPAAAAVLIRLWKSGFELEHMRLGAAKRRPPPGALQVWSRAFNSPGEDRFSSAGCCCLPDVLS